MSWGCPGNMSSWSYPQAWGSQVGKLRHRLLALALAHPSALQQHHALCNLLC